MDELAVFDTLLTRIRGHQLAALIHVAARWTLADRVGDGRPLEDLAGELAVDTALLRRAVRTLAAFDIFAIGDDDIITHTTSSRFLVTDAQPSLHAAARFWGLRDVWVAWGDLEQALRTGDCAFEARFGQSFFGHLQAHPEQSAVFQGFMSRSPENRHAAVARAYDFSRFARIADIGGGDGMQLAAILTAHPNITGLLYDRASVLSDIAVDLVGLARNDRCEIIPGDFLQSIPAGADAYLLSQILHDWSDASALRILRNCRDVMQPQSVLLIIERLFEPERGVTTPNSFLSDIEMLVLHGAAERSIDEYRTLLLRGGFRIERVVRTDSPFSLIECVPVQ